MEQAGEGISSSTILVSDPNPVKLIYEASISRGFKGNFGFRISWQQP